MIQPGYLRFMSRYNQWQNENLYNAADTLSDDERRTDRSAFFGSIHATLNHVLWADRLWMSRLSDWEKPDEPIAASTRLYDDWYALRAARREADERFVAWADTVSQDQIDGDLTMTLTSGRQTTRNRAMCLMQVFNHQTHHRGQVHAMLTATGAKPDDTDLQYMPESYR